MTNSSSLRGFLGLHLQALGDGRGDIAGRNRRSIIVQDGYEARRIDRALVDQKHPHLRVTILLHDKDLVARIDELDHLVRERKGTEPQRIEMEALGLQGDEGLCHGCRGGTEIDHAVAGSPLPGAFYGGGNETLPGLEFSHQTLHVVDISPALFPVFWEAVARGAAGGG